MTILTKGMGEKKPALNAAAAPEDTKAILAPRSDVEAGATTEPTSQDDFLYMTPRERTVSTLCLFLVALLITALGVAVGIHIYQQCAQQTVQFSGMFSIPYDKAAQQDFYARSSMLMSDEDRDDSIDKVTRDNRIFHEKVMTNSAERMSMFVPAFRDGRKGLFVHDFSVNKTVIVDKDYNTCFVMPLDTTRIVRPKNMIDLVKKIWDGTYAVNTTVVRETMRAAPFPKDEVLSPYLAAECEGKTLYKLYQVDSSGIVKRSADNQVKREAFYSFGGKHLTFLDILLPTSTA